MVEIISSWHVVLESAKDQILGVNTPGQHVPPCVRYGMACLLIRNVIVCVSYSVEWRMTSYFVIYFVNHLNQMVQEGTVVRKTLALQVGTVCWANYSKA
jgi:hypothetical protein